MAISKTYEIRVNGSNAVQSIQALQQQLNRLDAELKAAQGDAAKTTQVLQRMAQTKADLAALAAQMVTVGKANVDATVAIESAADAGVKSLTALRQEARLLQSQLATLPPGSAEAKEALESLANVKAEIGDLNTEIKLLDPGARLEGVVKLTQTVAGGFGAVTAAVQLFGGTGEDVAKVEAKMQSFLVLMQGLEAVRSGFEKQNLAGIKSMLSFGDSFTLAGVKAKLFGATTRTAIASTGIGLLVVALGTIIANFDAISSAAGRLYDRFAGVFSGIGKLVDVVVGKTRDLLSVVTFGLVDDAKTAAANAVAAAKKAAAEIAGIQAQVAKARAFTTAAQARADREAAEARAATAATELEQVQRKYGVLALLESQQLARLRELKNKAAEKELADAQAANAEALRAVKDARTKESQAIVAAVKQEADLAEQGRQTRLTRENAAQRERLAAAVKGAEEQLQAAIVAQNTAEQQLDRVRGQRNLDETAFWDQQVTIARQGVETANANVIAARRALSRLIEQQAQRDLNQQEADTKAQVIAQTRDNQALLAVELDFARQRRDLLVQQARNPDLNADEKEARLAAARDAATAVIQLDRDLGDARRQVQERIDDLLVAGIRDDTTRKLAEIEASADKQKAAVTGSEAEKQRQVELIDQESERRRQEVFRESATKEIALRRQVLEEVEQLRAARTDTLNDDLSAVNARLQREREAELAAAEKTGADKKLINAKYDLLVQQAADDSVNAQVTRFKQRFEEVGQLVQGIINTVTASIAARLDEQIADIDLRTQVLDDRLSDLDAQLSTRRSEIESIEQALATATGTRRAQLIAKLDQERNAERALATQRAQAADQLKKQEAEKIKLEREKQQLDKQGQAITAVSTALEAALALVKYNQAAADAGLKDPNPYTKAITIATVIAASIAGFASLKNALKFADGGYVSDGHGGMIRGAGGPTDDLIPARLSNGEFVVRAAVVEQPGMRAFLESVNAAGRVGMIPSKSGGYANGGLVTAPTTVSAGSGQAEVVAELRALRADVAEQTVLTTKAINAINTQVVIGEYQAVQIAELQQRVADREAAASL